MNSMESHSTLTTSPPVATSRPAPAVALAEHARRINFGVYDPEGKCQPQRGIAIEHVIISWATYQPGHLLRQLALIQTKGRWPFVTIEPWCNQTITTHPLELLRDVTQGKYDWTIHQLTGEIAAFRGLVFLRWGHAMETVTGRYPWASQNAALYQKAYRHFVTTSRLSANNIAYVWSPIGETDSVRYWPGEQYVDCVGLSVFALPEFDRDHPFRAPRPFHDQMAEKYARIAHYKKPVVVSECGVTGDETQQLSWLSSAMQDLQTYPLVKALIYFNADQAPGVWDTTSTTPDWRISESGLSSLVSVPVSVSVGDG
jgi:cellulose synthase (UDP-forming)